MHRRRKRGSCCWLQLLVTSTLNSSRKLFPTSKIPVVKITKNECKTDHTISANRYILVWFAFRYYFLELHVVYGCRHHQRKEPISLLTGNVDVAGEVRDGPDQPADLLLFIVVCGLHVDFVGSTLIKEGHIKIK